MKFYILTTLTLLTTATFGQTIQKCDRTILLPTSEKIGSLTQKEIADFLLTFGQEYRNNTEFSEWSNELLFSVLNKQTDLTIQTMEHEEKGIEIEQILNELSEPIHDKTNIKSLISRVEKVDIRKDLRSKIIERLKTANGKMQ